MASGALGRRLTGGGEPEPATTTTTTTLAVEVAATTTTTTTKVEEPTTTTTTTTVAQAEATTTTTTTTIAAEAPVEATTTSTTTTVAPEAPSEATTTTTTTTVAPTEATTTTTTTSAAAGIQATTTTTTTTVAEAPAETTTTTTTTPAPEAAAETTTTTTTTQAPAPADTTTTTTTTIAAPEATTTTTTTTEAPIAAAATTTTTTTTAIENDSLSTCQDGVVGWKDDRDYTCDDYATKQLCTPSGDYGPGWTEGTWSSVAAKDETAIDVCCACGGGQQMWAVQSGPCSVEEEEGCVTSPHYPDAYGNSEGCTIVAPKRAPVIRIPFFSTEAERDVLTVNGVVYSGTKGPEEVVPEGTITWSSDDANPGAGWKLCFESDYYYEERDKDAEAAAGGKMDYYDDEDEKEEDKEGADGGKDEEDDYYYEEEDEKDGENNGEDKEDDYYEEEEPQKPAEGPAGVWSIAEGPCTIDAAGCAVSPGYPQKYGNDEWCEIKVGAGEGPMTVASFGTESYFDYLTVNGQYYSGEVGPLGQAPTRNILWSSDEETTAGGWRLCPYQQGQAFSPVSPSSWVDSSIWRVASGACAQDAKGCITSPNYPAEYPSDGFCSIQVTAGKAEPIQVISFDTEHPLDYLQVNGKAYSGRVGPQGVIPQGEIIWSSDEDWTRPGWKICSSRGLVPHDGTAQYQPSRGKTGGAFLMGSAAALTIASVATVLWCRRKKTSFEPVYGRDGGSTPYGRGYMRDGL